MGKSRFNAKKFLKTVKSGIKKPDENYSEDNEKMQDDYSDLDSLNEAQESENKAKKKKGKFFNRVGGFFDPEPQKERVLSKEDFKGAGDVYFASVSAFIRS
ncbi:MAG: hypothetical protein IJD73_04575 [Clostridia bacterium]|nr:hypothetical protein [Clostridia bacterium]